MYQGNPNLLGERDVVAYTQAQIDEIRKCKNDPIYFIKNYVKIVTLTEGDASIVNFELYDFQEELIRIMLKERYVIAKWPRQQGKTTTVVAYFLHRILFTSDFRVAIIANKGEVARDKLGQLKFAYERLPLWMQQGVKEWNKSTIELNNGSKVLAGATSSSSIRGLTFNELLLDEFAHVDKNKADEFFNSVYPTISSGKNTKMFIISTPKGLNHFYTIWHKAQEKKNHFVMHESNWWDVPSRDEKWKKEQISNTSEEQFEQEFSCEFMGSSRTLIAGDKLKRMMELWTNPVRRDQGLDIYQEPIPGHTYALAVDVAQGLGLDSSAFSVVDVTTLPYLQVAKFKSSRITPMLYPTVIFTTAQMYNDAFVLVEINDTGIQVAEILHYELEYENIVKTSMRGRHGQQLTQGFMKKQLAMGLKMTVSSKRIGCANLKTLVENGKLLINDYDTIDELCHFIAQEQTYKAEEGHHDDLPMSLVIFSWLAAQRYFKDSLPQDIRKVLQKEMLDIEDDTLVPFIGIDDGVEQSRLREAQRLEAYHYARGRSMYDMSVNPDFELDVQNW